MHIIQEILSSIGIPTIICFVVWLVRLESGHKNNTEKLDILWKETERLESKHDLLANSLDKRLADTLDRLNESISTLTTATTKHSLQLENMERAVVELKDDIRERRT